MKTDITVFQQAFFDEATELLDDFEAVLLELETRPYDRELLNTIFRCAHSIKGGSATFGFPEIAKFTHGLETLLDQVRKGEVAITKSLCAILLESLDQMRILLSSAKGDSVDVPDSEALTHRIEQAASETQEIAVPTLDEGEGWGIIELPKVYSLEFRPGPDVLAAGNDPVHILRRLGETCEILEIECQTENLPNLADLELDKCYLSWSIRFRTDADHATILEHFEFIADDSHIELSEAASNREIDEAPETGSKKPVESATQSGGKTEKVKDGSTIKVSADKLDKLINLVGELVICQSMLNSVTENFEMDRLPRLIETVANMERASRELQERVMGVRLLQIKMAFGRFPRLVHDLASACGKKIELRMSGEDTELDKNLIEAIGDPLTHLIRNSVDHGLEQPHERLAAGKPETGVVSISAFHEGGSIVIEVTDDGRGLSKERILAKAIERGLITKDENLSDDQIYNLIYQPGFSTAERVTDLSGRGVGMDIVKQAIAAIGGTLKVTSVFGKGVKTRIRLPLTMAILEGQTMSVGEEVYIVPLTAIVESIRPKRSELHDIANFGEIVKVRGEVVPIIRLYEIFNIDPKVKDPCEASLVLVESEGRKIAILVDDLLGQGQVVIKSLEENYRKVDCIAGATILGDGRIALIVDVPSLIKRAVDASRAVTAA